MIRIGTHSVRILVFMLLCPFLQCTRTDMPGPGDAYGAFIQEKVLARGVGPLHKLSLAVKDNMDIKGYVSGYGNPLWKSTHPPAQKTAPAIQVLLNAGAKFVGKAQMDELAYSLQGRNFHYGTPINKAAPNRIPGGSSSGSAVAVAARLASIALGTDTGGSVRIPASYNGIYGIRPTHDRVPREGVLPLAPIFDTVGWFAGDASTLRKVGDVLLAGSCKKRRPIQTPRWLIFEAMFDVATKETSEAVRRLLLDHLQELKGVLGKPTYISEMTHGRVNLTEWLDTYLTCEGYEAWQYFRPWVEQYNPVLGPVTRVALDPAALVTKAQYTQAKSKRDTIRAQLLDWLGIDGIITFPTAPGPPPLLDSTEEVFNNWDLKVLTMTSLSSLGGLPQVSLPLVMVEGAPVGVSLIGPPGSDESLLRLAEDLAAVLKR